MTSDTIINIKCLIKMFITNYNLYREKTYILRSRNYQNLFIGIFNKIQNIKLLFIK